MREASAAKRPDDAARERGSSVDRRADEHSAAGSTGTRRHVQRRDADARGRDGATNATPTPVSGDVRDPGVPGAAAAMQAAGAPDAEAATGEKAEPAGKAVAGVPGAPGAAASNGAAGKAAMPEGVPGTTSPARTSRDTSVESATGVAAAPGGAHPARVSAVPDGHSNSASTGAGVVRSGASANGVAASGSSVPTMSATGASDLGVGSTAAGGAAPRPTSSPAATVAPASEPGSGAAEATGIPVPKGTAVAGKASSPDARADAAQTQHGSAEPARGGAASPGSLSDGVPSSIAPQPIARQPSAQAPTVQQSSTQQPSTLQPSATAQPGAQTATPRDGAGAQTVTSHESSAVVPSGGTDAAASLPPVSMPPSLSTTAQASAPAGPGRSDQPPLAAQLARPALTLAASGTPGSVTVHVTPDDLGQVTLRAQLHAGSVHVELFAAGDAGRDALRNALPELRRELAGQAPGTTVELSAGAPDDQRGSRRDEQHERASGGRAGRDIRIAAARAAPVAAASAPAPAQTGAGRGIDILV
jgi:flagellar hook-length control protein FliK